MAQENKDINNDDEKDTTATGSDIPGGDGTISDEDMQAITGENDDRPTGQDHSTEDHEKEMPRDGVGAIQDSSLIKEDVAHIEDEEG
ncbi:MAG: hypothetical protein ABI891_09300 [Acidobacteriota bacterium]